MSDTTESARPAWVDDRLSPFGSRFIEIDGNTVHYLDEGHGPTLLFLPGNPTWSFLRREVIGALDLERTTLVGQDWGGLILGGPAARFSCGGSICWSPHSSRPVESDAPEEFVAALRGWWAKRGD
ncbi:hypothetical protein [Nocardia asteroides]